MDWEAAQKALIKLGRQTGATWQKVRSEAFLGDTTIETGNTLYRFKDGIFSGRAPKPVHPARGPAWESPPNMKGTELFGFLALERGLWSLSARWIAGALAVITTNKKAFVLTSATVTCHLARPASAAVLTLTLTHAPPPSVRRPRPPSMTRLQPAPARPST